MTLKKLMALCLHFGQYTYRHPKLKICYLEIWEYESDISQFGRASNLNQGVYATQSALTLQ